jgi:O-antigen/teichoic acid export membrane protein
MTVNNSKNKKTFRRNVKWQLFGSISQAGISGVLLLLMGRELGTKGFGIFSIVMGYVYVANLLFDMRIQDVAAKQFWDFESLKYKSIEANQYFIDLFAVEALSKILPCLTLLLIAPLLADLGNLPSDSAALIMIAAVGNYFSKLGNGLAVGFLRVLGRSDLNVYCGTGELCLRLLLVVIFIYFSMLSVTSAVIIVAFSGIISNSILLILTTRQINDIGSALIRWRIKGAIQRVKKNKKLLLSNLGISISDLMSKDLDVTLLAPLIPADQVGLYKMAKTICLLTWRAIDPFYMALMPELIRLFSERDFDSVKSLIRLSIIRLFCFALFLSITTYIIFGLFGGRLLGEEYLGVLTLMPWMLVGVVASASMVWGHPLSVALDRADVAFMGSLLGMAIGVISFIILTPYFFVIGASIAWTLSFITQFIFTAMVSYLLLENSATINEA